MKTNYTQQYRSTIAESRLKPSFSEKESKELIIRWGNGARAVYTTADQAIRFIKLSKESDID